MLSPHSFASSQSSLLAQEQDLPQVELPSGGSSGDAFFYFDAGTGAGTSSVQRHPPYAGLDPEEPGIDENPLFEINDEGLLVDVPATRMTTSSVSGGAVHQNQGDDPDTMIQTVDEYGVLASTEV